MPDRPAAARILARPRGGPYDGRVSYLEPRRLAPRVPLDGLCGVVSGDRVRYATVLDLSEIGLAIERPFDPATARPSVQLELDLPGLDEVLWARAVVTSAHLSPMGGRTADGQPRFWCRAGLRITGIARSEQRLLRDYVHTTREIIARGDYILSFVS